jgi:hypothetical protein
MPALPFDLAVARFNESLRAIEKDTTKELSKALREEANKVRDKVRTSTARPYRTGKLRRSVKTSVRGKYNASLYSLLPQAGVLHWGGTIRPRGVPITFPKTEFVTAEVLAGADEFEERIADRFDEISHRHGWL